jgi:hypothetical protein
MFSLETLMYLLGKAVFSLDQPLVPYAIFNLTMSDGGATAKTRSRCGTTNEHASEHKLNATQASSRR